MQNRINNIRQWAIDRNFPEGALLTSQSKKLNEEFGELSGNLVRGRNIKDDVGDIIVVLVVMDTILGESNICEQLFDGSPLAGGDSELVDLIYSNMASHVGNISGSIGCQNMATLRTDMEHLVTSLVDFCCVLGIDIGECVDVAWKDIKDRKGEMRNGSFIKEADLTDDIEPF